MNSCLYACDVMHDRLEPKRNRFHYKVFMFYLDLDEITLITRTSPLISHNRWNIFSFRDDDHVPLPGESLKERIIRYAGTQGVDLAGGRIMLLTYLRSWGHYFNPVSFYFCFDRQGEPACTIVEVENTFRELKPYFLGKDTFQNGQFSQRVIKYFYVSPFIDLDASFDFRLQVPGERLALYIDDYKEGRKFFLSALTGQRKPLTNVHVLGYALRFPVITLQVLTLIHWQAMILWILKKLPYHKKSAEPNLEKELYNEYHE